MRRYHPQHQADIPITMDIGFKLSHASMMMDYKKEDWEIAEEAIDEWLRRHAPGALPLPPISGYQWKSLFLPDGTVLRTVFGGRNYHCHVENDGIVYEGKAVSPSGFVNAVGGIRRNAWRCTWVLLPSNNEWKLADTLRTRARPPRVRAPVRSASHAAPTPAQTTSKLDRAAPATDRISAPKEPSPDSVPETLNGAPRHGDMSPPTHATRGMERRINGADRLWPLLRAELLPLLQQLCAMDDGRCGTGRSHERQATTLTHTMAPGVTAWSASRHQR